MYINKFIKGAAFKLNKLQNSLDELVSKYLTESTDKPNTNSPDFQNSNKDSMKKESIVTYKTKIIPTSPIGEPPSSQVTPFPKGSFGRGSMPSVEQMSTPLSTWSNSNQNTNIITPPEGHKNELSIHQEEENSRSTKLFSAVLKKLHIHYIDINNSLKTNNWLPDDGVEIIEFRQVVTGPSGTPYVNDIKFPEGYTLLSAGMGAERGELGYDSKKIQHEYVYIKPVLQSIFYSIIDDSSGVNLESKVFLESGMKGKKVGSLVTDLSKITKKYSSNYDVISIDTLPTHFEEEPEEKILNIHLKMKEIRAVNDDTLLEEMNKTTQRDSKSENILTADIVSQQPPVKEKNKIGLLVTGALITIGTTAVLFGLTNKKKSDL